MRSAYQSAPRAPVFKGKLDSDGILGLQEISAIHLRQAMVDALAYFPRISLSKIFEK
jgi:hypothetical protein